MGVIYLTSAQEVRLDREKLLLLLFPLGLDLLGLLLAPAEPIHAPTGIHELLLARVEGVALRADLHVDLRLGGASGELGPASTPHVALDVLGMNSGLHEAASLPS
jgi:hypothetical protein